MAKPVIQQQFTLPAGVVPSQTKGSIRLASSVSDPPSTVGFMGTSSGLSVIGSVPIMLDPTGNLKRDDGSVNGVDLQLNPNSGGSADAITSPVGSVWYMVLIVPGSGNGREVFWLSVPDTAGPVNLDEILAIAPQSLEGYILDGGALQHEYDLQNATLTGGSL